MKHIFIISTLLFFLSSCGLSQGSESKESFNDLRETISVSSEEFEKKNTSKAQSILDKIEKEGKSEEGEKRKRAIHQIDSLETMMHTILKGAILQAEAVAGGNDDSGRMKNPAKVEGSEKLFLGNDPAANGSEGNGLAIEIKEKFTRVTQEFNQIRKEFGGEPLLSPTLPHPDQEGSWAQQTFGHKPIVASLAMLEKYKLDLGNMVDTTIELLD